jgi:hypothetical protein
LNLKLLEELAAGLAAVTLASGALASGACCALPAAVLTSTGAILAWLADMHLWVTGLAVLAVIGPWAWIAWQARRTRCKPVASTLYVMLAATALTALAMLWPLVEEQLAWLLMV